MVLVGNLAPDFQLQDQRGEHFRLSDFRGRMGVLLLFIPASFTPICSTEVPALEALADRFVREANVAPVIVIPDSTAVGAAWMRHLGLSRLRVLSDYSPQGQVAQAFGAWNYPDSICARATILVDKTGRIVFAEDVGKFGKRSMPQLLAIATQAAGGTPAPAGATARTANDLPIVYVTKGCPHCARVRAAIAKLGLGDKVVVRVLDGDTDAMTQLLAIDPHGSVPTMVKNGKIVAQGDVSIVNALSNR